MTLFGFSSWMEHILIIGGTGNISFPLIESLSKNKNILITAGVHDILTAHKKMKNIKNVTIKPFDFLDPSTFHEAFLDVNKVFFIRPPQLSKPKDDMASFLNYAQQQRIQQIVFVSLIVVEKNPVTPHHKIEKMIRQLKLPYTFIRPSFFMQNLNTTHQENIRVNHDLFILAGHSKTSFIDTRDIGEVASVCLTDSKYLNQELEITGPEALTYEEIAREMSTILGTTISYSQPSLLKFRRVMIERGFSKDYVNVMVMLYSNYSNGECQKGNHCFGKSFEKIS